MTTPAPGARPTSASGAAPALERAVTFDPSVPTVIAGTLVVVLVAGSFWLLFEFAATAFSLFGAMVLGTALRPGLEWLHRRGLSRSTSAVLVYLALVAALVGLCVLLLPLVLSQAATTAAQLPGWMESVRAQMLASSSAVLKRIAVELPLAQTAAAALPLSTITGAQAFAGSKLLGHGFFSVLAVLLLGFYWSLEGEVAVRSLLHLLAPPRREGVRELVEAAESKVGDYVRGQLVVCLVTAALAIVAFTALGLPGAIALASIAGTLGAVPIFGALLGFMPAALVAATFRPGLVPWVLCAGVTIHLVQEYVVAPRVMRRAVGVHPFVVLLAITGFGSFLGVAGAVLAIPMAAVLQLLLDRFVFDPERRFEPEPPAQRDRLGVLRLEARGIALDARRHGRVKEAALGNTEDAVDEMVESIANELDSLLVVRLGDATAGGKARRP